VIPGAAPEHIYTHTHDGYIMKIFLQENAVEATKQKGERKKKDRHRPLSL
jgi:hypothetical protein